MNGVENNTSTTDVVSRFLFHGTDFTRSTGRVRYNTLMPNSAGETSVFRITTLTPDGIWKLGEVVANKSNRTLRARGDIVSSDVSDVGLVIEPETQSHPLHANIVGWPAEKAKKMLLAKKLSEKAALKIKGS